MSADDVEMKEREPLQGDEGNKAHVIKMTDAAQNGGATSPTRAAPAVAFAGMTKEELMHFANDPFWIRIRWFLFILFWLIWFGMIAGAVAVILTAPKCPQKPDVSVLEEKAVVYVPANVFKDATGAGPDFLNELTAKLGDLNTAGLEGIWIERFEDLQDPMDIEKVNPEVLTFLEEAHKTGGRVLVEINPNRTPLKHPWFEKSKKKEGKFAHYYVWRSSPNNWLTAESGTGAEAWKRDPMRGEFYYFAEADGYADLNLRNAEVRAEVDKILRFWLDHHAAGFVVSGARYLYEDPQYKDAPIAKNVTNVAGYDALNFDGVSRDLPANRELLAEWKKIVDEANPEGTSPKFMVVKTAGQMSLGNATHVPAHGVVAGGFGSLSPPVTGFKLAEAVTGALASSVHGHGHADAPFALWPVAFQQRPMDVFRDEKLVNSIVALAALLPGAPVYRFNETALSGGGAGGSEMAALMKLRAENGIKFGDFKDLFRNSDYYAFIRVFGKQGFVVVAYFGDEATAHFDAAVYDERIPEKGTIKFHTGAGESAPGTEALLSSISIDKNEVVVIAFEPKPAM